MTDDPNRVDAPDSPEEQTDIQRDVADMIVLEKLWNDPVILTEAVSEGLAFKVGCNELFRRKLLKARLELDSAEFGRLCLECINDQLKEWV